MLCGGAKKSIVKASPIAAKVLLQVGKCGPFGLAER